VFEPTAASALGGPGWLRARRSEAVDRLSSRSLPTTDEEVWRYSRVSELEPTDFTLVAEPPHRAVPPTVTDLLASLPDRAGAVVVRNGFVVHAELAEPWQAKGVRFGPASTMADAEELVVGDDGWEPPDYFALANQAFTSDPVALDIPAGLVVEHPFVVVDWLDSVGAAVFPQVVVNAGADSQANLLEWQGSAVVQAFAAPVTRVRLHDAARLGHVVVQTRHDQVWQVANQAARVGRDASLVAAQGALGGDYARTRVDCELVGRGASGNLIAVYFGEGDQMLDFRTFQDHAAPDTTSNLLFKGAVSGRSRSVYTGLIHVGKEARGTNAFQTNRNIKLSDGAWAESVPNLEIENNDVRCSHASTVGPVDEEQLFYLESRGVPTSVAERLIVAGFFDEVLDQLPVATVAALLELEIDRRLSRGET
jgi:Fe-S cluster assembly protein SufD